MTFSLSLSQQTDERLMERAAHGSERAFEELYNRYAQRLQGFFLRQLGGDGELAADLTHDVFLRVYDARTTYQPKRMVAPWIFTVAYNLLKNRYRHIQVEAEAMALLDRQAIEECEVEVRMDRDQFDRALQHVLSALSPPLRLLFSLRYEEDLTVPQIAQMTGVAEGTVKSRLHKIMTLIKKKLNHHENI